MKLGRVLLFTFHLTTYLQLLLPGKSFSVFCLHSALLSTLILIINELRCVDKVKLCLHCYLHSWQVAVCTCSIKGASVGYREGDNPIAPTSLTPSLCRKALQARRV